MRARSHDRLSRRLIGVRALVVGVACAAAMAAGLFGGGGEQAAFATAHGSFDEFDADATGRHYPNAYLLAFLSYYVYEGEVNDDAVGDDFEPEFEAFVEDLGLTKIDYINVVATDTQAMVVETDDAVIVVFRGTQQLADFLTDIMHLTHPVTLDGIHPGFNLAAGSAFPEVLAAVESAGDKEVWLTGHSLGGALAQVTGYYLAAANALVPGSVPDVQGIVTFGSPRVFTFESVAAIAYRAAYGESRSQRWVNHFDPVPHAVQFPPFFHQSNWTVITVGDGGECFPESKVAHVLGIPDLLADHDVPRYVTRLFWLMDGDDRLGLPLPPLPEAPVAECDALAPLPPSAPEDDDAAANRIDEGDPAGTAVGITATASDPNGDALTFSLTGDADGRFAIDPDTGMVTIGDASLINYEDDTSHNITVRVSDGSLHASEIFTIAVRNVAPTTPQDLDVSPNRVSESADNGTYVSIDVQSADPNGPAVNFTLSNDAGGRFGIDVSTGAVTVANAALLNYEDANGHDITVRASDGVTSSSRAFTIAVTNTAPSTPTDANGAADQLAEGAPNGASAGIRASSTDPNGPAVSYSLDDDAGGRFDIGATSGIVTVADATLLNYEDADSHGITVRASDGVLSTTADFTVSVLNVAPSTPDDDDPRANEVAEGALTGTAVGVTAASSDPNGPDVTYALTDDAGGRFAIDASSGVISVAEPALLDGPASHDVTVATSHVGESSAPRTFTVAIANTPPVAAIDTLEGGIEGIALVGVPVAFSGSFTDAAVLDTHAASIDWGDSSADETFGGATVTSPRAAQHTYTAPGEYTVTFTVTDDDGESHAVTADVTVYDPVGAVQSLIDEVDAMISAESDPAVRAMLQQARDLLDGNEDGAQDNGALDKIESNDPVAAVGKIKMAIEGLADAQAAGGNDTTSVQRLLAVVARSIVQEQFDAAVASIGPSPTKGEKKQLDKIRALVADGVSHFNTANYVVAVDKFEDAVQLCVPLID